ncbi:MAG: magnesium/cobalt transporter CorA [Betaproteobacteria bacterium]|nr:magnesium/cobalt transporter CorA [Betaproteobacteria bacterium]
MLINCVLYENGKRLADIPQQDISEHVGRAECFIWVGLLDPSREELDEMAVEFGLHPLAVEDARKGHQRPKIEEYDDSLFAVLHTIDASEDGSVELEIGEVDMFVGRNYVLSVRHRTRRGFSEVRQRCEREPELLRHGAGFVFYALMDAIVDRYFPVLQDLESALEAAEQQLFGSSSSSSKIEDLYALKGRLMTLKHAVLPLLDDVGKLQGGRVPPVCVGTQEYFRDVYDHLLRINATIESIREMLATAISVNIALIGISDAEITKRLAAWGALITVPTLIAGVYGMNFEHMPELRWIGGYPLALVVMFVVDAVLFWRFRRAQWI